MEKWKGSTFGLTYCKLDMEIIDIRKFDLERKMLPKNKTKKDVKNLLA